MSHQPIVQSDDTIVFTGSAIDREGRVLTGNSITWSSNLDGPIGTGGTISTSSLSVNQHLITITATDSNNFVDSTQILIDIKITFEKTFGGAGEDRAQSVMNTSDGGYIIIGTTESFGVGGKDVYLIKTDKFGNLVWENTFGGVGGDYGNSVQETPDGNYIIAGTTSSFGAGNSDFYLIKVDNDGNLIWENHYGGGSYEFGSFVNFTSDGGFILTGYKGSTGTGNSEIYLIKTDSIGVFKWEKTFGGEVSGNDFGFVVYETPDSGFIISGFTNSYGAGSSDVYLIKTDNFGNFVWDQTYGGASWDLSRSAMPTTDGGYIITGLTFSYGAGSSDVYLIKTDDIGSLIWEKTIGGFSYDEGHSVSETSDGGFIVVGVNAASQVFLVKTDINGEISWEKTFGGGRLEIGYSVSETSDNGFIITGFTESYGAGMKDVYLIKTDSEGNVY